MYTRTVYVPVVVNVAQLYGIRSMEEQPVWMLWA